jgi:Family of unknown function (DUF6114)
MAAPTAQGRSIYADPALPSTSIYTLEPRPRAAAALVGVGALFVVIESFVLLVAGVFISTQDLGVYGGALVTAGILDAVVGVLMFGVSLLIYAEPHHHVANGLFAVILVFLSFLVGFGGFFIGGILALVGGLIAIFWTAPVLGVVAVAPRSNAPNPR